MILFGQYRQDYLYHSQGQVHDAQPSLVGCWTISGIETVGRSQTCSYGLNEAIDTLCHSNRASSLLLGWNRWKCFTKSAFEAKGLEQETQRIVSLDILRVCFDDCGRERSLVARSWIDCFVPQVARVQLWTRQYTPPLKPSVNTLPTL